MITATSRFSQSAPDADAPRLGAFLGVVFLPRRTITVTSCASGWKCDRTKVVEPFSGARVCGSLTVEVVTAQYCVSAGCHIAPKPVGVLHQLRVWGSSHVLYTRRIDGGLHQTLVWVVFPVRTLYGNRSHLRRPSELGRCTGERHPLEVVLVGHTMSRESLTLQSTRTRLHPQVKR
jgi:hypothetical protein